MKPARKAYLMNRGKHRRVLVLQVRLNGRLTPFWIQTEPFVCATSCPSCGAQPWQPCIGRNSNPKVRPHDGRFDAYSDGIRRGTLRRWQECFDSASPSPSS